MEKNNKIALVIGYYLSKFDKVAYESLGYKNFKKAVEGIGEIINVKATTIKNMRDEFDPIHDNGRKGWHQKPLSGTRKSVVNLFENYSQKELKKFITKILNNEENFRESDELNEILDYISDKNVGEIERGVNMDIGKGSNGEIKRQANNRKMNPKEKIQSIQSYITSKGYIYSYEDLCNFYLSFKTKPFVILAGTSGTGKSKLVRLFAESIGVTKDDGFNMISVRPDWNDSTDLIGYKNIEDRFVPGKFTNIIKEALSEENREKIYIICLDEMNLARVEYYFSEYLSLIESREWDDESIVTDRILSEEYVKEEEYNKLHLPDNLYVVGTVNMDDTTFSFSKKVLDRANTIEFSQVDLENLDFSNSAADIINESNSFLRTSFLNIKDALNEDEAHVKEVNKSIVEINNILKKGGKHFGYRVRDEIVFYMMENKKSGLLKEETALDYQIMQKILPAISGSDRVIKDILIELYNFCNPNKKIADNVDYIKDGEKHISDAIYKRSAEKIIKMMRGYEDGYTSFWE